MKRVSILVGITLALSGCRGGISDSPPVHLVHDMDNQPKLKPQSRSDFAPWTDHRAMRVPVFGTVARGSLREGPLYQYKLREGTNPEDYVAENPLPLTMEVMERGQERFNITCAMCHGISGRGGSGPLAHGIVGRYWSLPIASFVGVPGGTADDNRVSELRVGQIFEVITEGKSTMPSYAHMISVEDRWSIIHYIQALKYQALN